MSSQSSPSPMITFDELNLNKPLLNALDDLGYVYPTPIQAKVFPIIMSGKNVVGLAQTGTGKTFAYLLPLLRQLKYSEQAMPRILIVVPTRELVIQVLSEIEKLSKYMTIRYGGVYGGSNMSSQKALVSKGLDVLVATPGRLIDLIANGILRLKAVQQLVIDEVDEMLNLGFRTQLMNLFGHLPAKRQNLLFSATLSKDVEKLIYDYILDPQKIEITPQGAPIEKIIQQAYQVPNFNSKASLLQHLLLADEALSKVLVFVKSKKMADELFALVTTKLPGQIGVIHSNKSQPQRFKAIKKFEDGTHRVLIATDIIARGLNIAEVTHVINFDTPDVAGDYIHRIGRTGRADANGFAITFVNEAEELFQQEIETFMGKRIQMMPFPAGYSASTILTEDEKPSLRGKNPLKSKSTIKGEGAFHEKKGKNKKVNLGGPGKRYVKTGSVRSARKKKSY
jgi:ATP-dependent RNA helicase RhlE